MVFVPNRSNYTDRIACLHGKRDSARKTTRPGSIFLGLAVNRSNFFIRKDKGRMFDRIAGIEWNAVDFDRSLRVENVLCLPQVDCLSMWGICCVCTLALTVAKTSFHYDNFHNLPLGLWGGCK